MKFILSLLASVLIALAWLLPIHYRPWVTYTGELFAFFALFALVAMYLKGKTQLPILNIPILILAIIPLIQWGFGQVFYFSTALMASIYLFAFGLCTIIGYNLAINEQERKRVFTWLSYVFLVSGTLTGWIAISQWLTIEQYFPGMVNMYKAVRPFANFAQPNNMATFLLMSLLAGLYLYEKRAIKVWIISVCACIMVLGVALSQSRTSWLACACILVYGGYQYYKGLLTIKPKYALAWLSLLLIFIFTLPSITQLIASLTTAELSQTKGVVARATGDMSRLAIWQQMVHAIIDRPWFGYGWNQTSVAYTLVSEHFQGPVWIRSAHNFILDFILWNGLILGIPFLLYFSYWGFLLLKQVKSTESVIGILMVGVFLVHALLEFPQNYAYFLLPVGFILGVVQAQQKQKSIQLSPYVMRGIFVVGLILLGLIYRDYNVLVPKLNQSMRFEKQPEKITIQDKIYILTELDERINWIRLDPKTQLSWVELERIHKMVLSYPTKYDVLKYARALAYNGYEKEARHQLWLLKQLKHVDVSYESLLEPTQ
ncbi:polymerase [Acinetobacter tandoii]|uniref:PglL family O-oligosaccharyltransferase n=1 Tax=Acinetobacter tandoii TaxID=202954 RepID=UPI000C207F8B|nr:O-antigen ligase family protein [Acinetobacter tandoii]PJG43423.1 polymerase [Acinetobacter tandoii]